MQKNAFFQKKLDFLYFFPKIPPQNLDKQGISLYYPSSILSGWLVNIYQPVYWSVKLYLGVKKVGLFSEIFLSKTASSVQSLNTTQHIKETLSNAINLSGTRRPAWNFSYGKFPAGLFLFKSFSFGYFPVCAIA